MMTRKDVSQDIDRPHYYSQFWIDIAGGKRDVAAVRAGEADIDVEDVVDEDEHEIEPIPVAKVAPKPKPVKATEKKAETARPTITSLADLANIDLLMKSSAEMDTDEVPDIESGAIDDLGPLGQEPDVTAPNLEAGANAEDGVSAQAEDDSEFEDLDYDEDEEDEEWGGPRKSSKQQKQQRRRERRPNF